MCWKVWGAANKKTVSTSVRLPRCIVLSVWGFFRSQLLCANFCGFIFALGQHIWDCALCILSESSWASLCSCLLTTNPVEALPWKFLSASFSWQTCFSHEEANIHIKKSLLPSSSSVYLCSVFYSYFVNRISETCLIILGKFIKSHAKSKGKSMHSPHLYT